MEDTLSPLDNFYLFSPLKPQGDAAQFKSWFNIAANELDALQIVLKELEKGLNCSDATLQLRNEVTNLKNKVNDVTSPMTWR